jgi:hypothetical protein
MNIDPTHCACVYGSNNKELLKLFRSHELFIKKEFLFCKLKINSEVSKKKLGNVEKRKKIKKDEKQVVDCIQRRLIDKKNLT